MNFELTAEQRLMADAIERFFSERYDFEHRRRVIASSAGVDAQVWHQLAQIGVLSIPFSEPSGGFGGGAVDMMSTMQAIGGALAVEPVLATVLAGRLVDRLGSQEQRDQIMSAVIEGSARLALAHTEDHARYNLSHVTARAKRDDDDWVISGVKRVVTGAPSARWLLVSARTSEKPAGVSLFIVPAAALGVAMTPYQTVDGHRAADVRFDDVRVGFKALLGVESDALCAIEEALDFATALLCAEAVGAILYANAATLEYLKTRKQFGVPIGSFQALQHRMVEMFISLEQARSISYLACSTVDATNDPRERGRVLSMAKIKVADACRLVSQEAVQMHGGIGMTDELKLSHAFRRMTMIAQQFGDADYHLERFAALDC